MSTSTENSDSLQPNNQASSKLEALQLITPENIEILAHNWASFSLTIISPEFELSSPTIINPDVVNGAPEFVYDIIDTNRTLSTSKADTMYDSGRSMCKLYFTIEKMIFLLIERLKETGTSKEDEVQVELDGYQFAVRKGFESIINLDYNVICNYDPGEWGERFLTILKTLSDRGYGLLPEAPRDIYRQRLSSGSGSGSRSLRGR